MNPGAHRFLAIGSNGVLDINDEMVSWEECFVINAREGSSSFNFSVDRT